jgi:hypothetical protein
MQSTYDFSHHPEMKNVRLDADHVGVNNRFDPTWINPFPILAALLAVTISTSDAATVNGKLSQKVEEKVEAREVLATAEIWNLTSFPIAIHLPVYVAAPTTAMFWKVGVQTPAE